MTSRKRDVIPFTEVEWNFVKNNFNSNNIEKLSQALDILNLWECRAEVKSIVFTLTKDVVHAHLYDLRNTETSDPYFVCQQGEEDARKVYSYCVMRFVSYLYEVSSGKEGRLESMSVAAQKMGIPNWVVQLRHTIAHCDLPTLEELRNAHRIFRQWLWDFHWRYPVEIALIVPGAEKPAPCVEEDAEVVAALKLLFKDYRTIVCSRSNDKTEIAVGEQRLAGVLKKLGAILSTHPHQFIVGVTQNIILSPETMAASFKFDCSEDGKRIWPIPLALARFWKRMVNLFEDNGCYGMFLGEVTAKLSNPSVDFHQKAQYAGWATVLFDRLTISGMLFRISSDLIYAEISLSAYDVKNLLNNFLEGAKFFEKRIFEQFLNQFGDRLGKDTREQYTDLFNIHVTDEEMPEVSDSNDTEILTLDSLAPHIKRKKLEKKDWRVVSQRSPMGLTPGQASDTLDLRLKK